MVLYDVGSYHLQFQTTHQKKEMMRIEINTQEHFTTLCVVKLILYLLLWE